MTADWQEEKAQIFNSTVLGAGVFGNALLGKPRQLSTAEKIQDAVALGIAEVVQRMFPLALPSRPVSFAPLTADQNRQILTLLICQENKSPEEKAGAIRRFISAPERKIDLEGRNVKGMTVLMHAARLGCREVVQALVEKGAMPATKDNAGKTAADHARAAGHETVERLLDPEGVWSRIEDLFMKGIPVEQARPPGRLVIKEKPAPKP